MLQFLVGLLFWWHTMELSYSSELIFLHFISLWYSLMDFVTLYVLCVCDWYGWSVMILLLVIVENDPSLCFNGCLVYREGFMWRFAAMGLSCFLYGIYVVRWILFVLDIFYGLPLCYWCCLGSQVNWHVRFLWDHFLLIRCFCQVFFLLRMCGIPVALAWNQNEAMSYPLRKVVIHLFFACGVVFFPTMWVMLLLEQNN